MDERIAMIQDLLNQAQTVIDEIVAEQQPVEEAPAEEVAEPSMPKEEYLAKPESERAALDLKNVMNRKPKQRV